MDKDRLEANDYLARQNFSEGEIKDLHQGRLEFRKEKNSTIDWGEVMHQYAIDTNGEV